MNYIKQLQSQNEALTKTLSQVNEEMISILKYLRSEKFQGFENDYVHVGTDMVPKLEVIKNIINL